MEYFPHFAKHGKTLFILKSQFGNDGYAFWFQLLELLCREEDHYYSCKDEHGWQYLLSYTGVNEITGTEILTLLAKLGNIDPEMWDNKIIWCENLVLNLSDVYKRRGRPQPERPILVDNNKVTATENPISASEIPVTASEMPQSKVEESKVKNSKEDGGTIIANKKYNNQWLQALRDEFGDLDFDEEIKKFEDYWTDGRRNLKSPKLALRNWMIKAREIKKDKPSSKRNLPDDKQLEEGWHGT